jgi:hypothetical protein
MSKKSTADAPAAAAPVVAPVIPAPTSSSETLTYLGVDPGGPRPRQVGDSLISAEFDGPWIAPLAMGQGRSPEGTKKWVDDLLTKLRSTFTRSADHSYKAFATISATSAPKPVTNTGSVGGAGTGVGTNTGAAVTNPVP